jgi:hypothetical protein
MFIIVATLPPIQVTKVIALIGLLAGEAMSVKQIAL